MKRTIEFHSQLQAVETIRKLTAHLDSVADLFVFVNHLTIAVEQHRDYLLRQTNEAALEGDILGARDGKHFINHFGQYHALLSAIRYCLSIAPADMDMSEFWADLANQVQEADNAIALSRNFS